MAAPFISIVIPVLNRASIVGRTLDSVSAQTFGDYELIVVDNGSTDGTADAVRSWHSVHPTVNLTLLTESERGAARARNRGLDAAQGEWTMFFDSDDTMRPDLLEAVKKASREADVVAWDVIIHQLDGSVIRQCSYLRNALFHTIFHGNFSTQRYAAATRLFRSVGGWNAVLRGWDDAELGVRLLLQKPLIRHLRDVEVDVYAQSVSITGVSHSSDTAKWEDALSAMRNTLSEASEQKAVHWIDLRRAILAGQYAREGAEIESDRLLAATLKIVDCRRWIYRWASRLTASGCRGAARLFGWLC